MQAFIAWPGSRSSYAIIVEIAWKQLVRFGAARRDDSSRHYAEVAAPGRDRPVAATLLSAIGPAPRCSRRAGVLDFNLANTFALVGIDLMRKIQAGLVVLGRVLLTRARLGRILAAPL